MRIGFDAKRLFLNQSGLGNYSRWLVSGLKKIHPENDYHLYTTQINHSNSHIQKEFQDDSYNIHLPSNLLKGFWRSKGIKKDLIQADINIYHGLSNEIPIGIEKTKIKSVVTIHDLIFKLYPQFYPFIDRKIYDKKFKSACERADKIVAVSEHTKNLIIQYYGIAEQKIEVIYMDAHPNFLKPVELEKLEIFKKEYGLDTPFFMNVGSYGGRKNQMRILEAFAMIASKIEHNLIFVGNKTAGFDKFESKIRELNLTGRVQWMQNVSDKSLRNLYQLSYATVYPSLYEGFGIPIVESFRSGKPVISSFGSSLEEITGLGGVLCNPLEIEDLANKMEELTSSQVYLKLKNNINTELLRFDSVSLMNNYQSLYRKLLS